MSTHSMISSLHKSPSSSKNFDFASRILMADALSRFPLVHLISPHVNNNTTSPLLLPLFRIASRSDLVYKTRFLSNYRLNQLSRFKVHAAVAEESDEPKWWEKTAGPNMIDIHSTQEFLNALSQAGDKLVIVEFYGTWCGSCRALFPKLCKIAEENPEIIFLKVNFDENKPMCKRLNVRVLPYFHFYRGADGLLESFSCSLAKFQKLKDAIAIHSTPRCSIGPLLGVGDLNLVESATQEKPAEASSR